MADESAPRDLWALYAQGRKLRVRERLAHTEAFVGELRANRHIFGMTEILSEVDRVVKVFCPIEKAPIAMRMFASNSYLNLSTHPTVKKAVQQAVAEHGVGTGGSPTFNGSTHLHRKLEERLAAWVGTESVLLFSSGYAANLGVFSGLMQKRDAVVADELLHSSCWDGLKMAGVAHLQRFRHNDLDDLAAQLDSASHDASHDTFVAVESIYSMDGDLAPLGDLAALCQKRDAVLVVDDAHGVGVLGEHGRGALAHYGVKVDVMTASFAKAFGVLGGFAAGTRAMVDYLRFVARPHIFSTALSPATVAAVLAGLDLLETDPSLHARLQKNVAYASQKLARFGATPDSRSAILVLSIPLDMDVVKAAASLYESRVLLNYAAFPAVPLDRQRFRICLMTNHTSEDIDHLAAALERVWSTCRAA